MSYHNDSYKKFKIYKSNILKQKYWTDMIIGVGCFLKKVLKFQNISFFKKRKKKKKQIRNEEG